MKQYKQLLNAVLHFGNEKGDRTGTGTLSLFGYQMRFDLERGFPLLTTKKMFLRGAIEELLWFIRGSTDVKELQAVNVNFWNDWVDEEGAIGHGYGKQFRHIESYVSIVPKLFTPPIPPNDTQKRSVFNIGYYGNANKKDPNYKWLVNIWREMLRRCYHKDCKAYASYGSKGVHVTESWQCFENFQRDVKLIPNWALKLEYPEEYSLDKDILWASNRYGKDTCMWATHEEQSCNSQTTAYFTAVSPDGDKLAFPSIGTASRDHNLNLSAIHRCLLGKLKTHHGWSEFQYLKTNPGEILRYRKIDQLKQLIAEIKHNPNSRRLIIALWNPQDTDRTTLPPCHGNIIQFYVADGKLSCLMVQRSADIFLGVPINIASYALLTHMIAQQCNLGVGEFIWNGNDVHLYNNHIEQAKMQLKRSTYPLPSLVLSRKPDSIFDYTIDDFKIVNYFAHPHIKGEISV